ncbi:MAG: ABC transporter permease, partial [Saprospiraceae bacterium]
ISLFAGFYPAAVMSSFQPVAALKKQFNPSFNKLNINYLRKGLIVFQFTVALVLITGTYIIGEQIQFILNKDLGFAQEAIVYSKTPWQKGEEKSYQFYQALQTIPAIEASSMHLATPSGDNRSVNLFDIPNNEELKKQLVYQKFIDEHYLDLFEIELLAGRNVMPSDSLNQIVVNEQLARQMGYSDAADALNQTIKTDDESYPIVGVVKDFHHKNLQVAIEPLLLRYAGFKNYVSYKFQPQTDGATIEKTIAEIAAIWQNIYPEIPYDFSFYDESVAQMYETERQTAKLMQTATFVAVLISCLGLFGLVSFMVVQRTREIGIRKVLGASVANIVGLLSKDFLWLVGIAIFIGTPIAYWLGQRWLADYAYAIEVEWWMFGLTAALAIGIAFLTVSTQSLRAALINPVDSLKEE